MKTFTRKSFDKVQAFEVGSSLIGKPMMSVFFYYIDGTLIDCGHPHMRKSVLHITKSLAMDKILLTHHHEDHSGNAAEVARQKNIPVYGHYLTAEKMKGIFHIHLYRRYVWGNASPCVVTGFSEQIEGNNYIFTPVFTPGHCRDHTSYLVESEGWLFSGDLFVGSRIRYFMADENMTEIIASLRKVLSLRFDSLWCGHNPKISGGRQLIAEKLSFLEDFYGKVLNFRRAGMPVSKIVPLMGKEFLWVKFITHGDVSLKNMVLACLHKDY